MAQGWIDPIYQTALNALKVLVVEEQHMRPDEGRPGSGVRIEVEGWQYECQELGIESKQLSEVKKSLEQNGDIKIDGNSLFLADRQCFGR